jgi:hypothetical protein
VNLHEPLVTKTEKETKMPNIELVRQALQFMKDNPNKWNQGDFCSISYDGELSKACFGGIVAKLHSDQDWAHLKYYISTSVPFAYTSFTSYGRNALGITDDQAYSLFFTIEYCETCNTHINLDAGPTDSILHRNCYTRHISFNEYVDVVSQVLDIPLDDLKVTENA